MVGIGPGVVEHILALAVGLEIGRHHATKPACLLERDVPWMPAAVFADGAGCFQRMQESV